MRACRSWTPDEVEILRKRTLAGERAEDIAAILNRSRYSVAKKRAATRILVPKKPRFEASASPLLVSDIKRAVAQTYGLSVEDLCQPDGMGARPRDVARPRQVAMYLARKMCPDRCASLTAIGRQFGGRDHTTVLHGCRVIEGLMLSDTEERRAVGEVGLKLIDRAGALA